MKKFVKSSIWSDPLKVGCVSQLDLIDKHFQQFLLINRIMSNYQRKRDRSRELNQSWLKVILFLLGNFHPYVKRMSWQVYLFSFDPVKTGCIFQGKNIFSSKYFDLDCVFISNTRDGREQGIPQRQTKSTSWFYFRNTVLKLAGASRRLR